MSATGKLAFAILVLFCAPASADDDAPAIHQAKPNFHNAMTNGNLAVSWTAMPTEFAFDSDTQLTLTVSGATNPHRVRRPDLANHPAFKTLFRQIANADDSPANREAKSVTFTWMLRPRTSGKMTLPEMPYLFYHTPSGTIREKYLDKIELSVRPAATTSPTVRPLEAPDRFFSLNFDEARLQQPISAPRFWHWLVLVCGLPILGTLVVIAWRHFNPEGVRLARLRQNLAIRDALDGLDRAKRSAEPIEHTQRVIETYLLERHGQRLKPTVPSELEAMLANADVRPDRVETAISLLRQCEAARFGTNAPDANTLLQRIREFILSEEVAV
jgi:hypothetical protein